MPIDFPNSPTNGDTYSAGGKNWQYNGTSWVLQGVVPTIPTGSITESQLAANSVTTAKIAAGAVVEADIATGAVTAGKIDSGAVTEAKIGTGAVTAGKLASGVAAANLGFTPAPAANPTFTGTVTLPSTTSIGTVSSTEIGYVDGVTSAIQTQLNAKAPVASPTFTGVAQVSGDIQQNVVHGYNVKLDLAPGNNGAGTGQAVLALWISEPGATWTGAGIARNRVNTTGFPRINTGLSAQMIRFTETPNGGVEITCTSSSSVDAYFTFDSSGNAYKAGGGSWSAPSDVRLKENIRDYEKGTTELMQIRVREWEHNGKGGLKEGSSGLGVVADEIELILPSTVQTYEGKLNPSDEETTDIKAVNPTEITWLLVKTVQEQQAVIQNLQARIAVLEGGV